MKLGEAMREEIKWSLNLIIKVIIHIEKKMWFKKNDFVFLSYCLMLNEVEWYQTLKFQYRETLVNGQYL